MSDIDLKALNRLLDEVGPELQKANQTEYDPAITKTVGDGVYSAAYGNLSASDSMYLQRRLNGLSLQEKGQLLQMQLQKGAGQGVPADRFLQQVQSGVAQPQIERALDTTGGLALIRQDLEPFLTSMFVSVFPAWQRFSKVPANGLVHAWDQVTAYASDTTTSSFISELGTVVDKTGSYTKQTTNIAVYGQRRGVSFKQQLAVPAGGMSWDSARLEIQNGLTQMAHDLQKTIFQGQASNSGGTASNELGLYDANAFTGLRSGLNNAYAVNFQPYLTTGADSFVEAFNEGVTNIANNVGVPPTLIYARMNETAQFSNQQLSLQRTVDRTEFIPGLMTPAVATAAGILPILGIPGDAIGTYTATGTFDANTVADLYMLNESEVTIPYLGSPGPSVIEIPPGVAGQLTRLYIVWGMFGLALLSNLHSIKLRADTSTS